MNVYDSIIAAGMVESWRKAEAYDQLLGVNLALREENERLKKQLEEAMRMAKGDRTNDRFKNKSVA